jgi:hypothetical protein
MNGQNADGESSNMDASHVSGSGSGDGFSPLSLKQQLDHAVARIEAVEDRVSAAEMDIRNINSYSMRKNMLFNGLVTKEELGAPGFDLRRHMLKFCNDTLFGRNRLTDADFGDVHPTAATKGEFVQIFVEFRLHQDAIDAYDNANRVGPENHRRKQAVVDYKNRTGRTKRAICVGIVWQMEEVARKMQAYLYELKFRMKEAKPSLNLQAVTVTSGTKKDRNPKICFAGKSFSVFDLPIELQMLMPKPWARDFQRPKGVFRPSAAQQSAIEQFFITSELSGLLLAGQQGSGSKGKPAAQAPTPTHGGVGRGKRTVDDRSPLAVDQGSKNRKII